MVLPGHGGILLLAGSITGLKPGLSCADTAGAARRGLSLCRRPLARSKEAVMT